MFFLWRLQPIRRCSGVHKLVKRDGHTEERDAGKMMAVCLCVYVWHRWNDFSGITVWLWEQRGGNCILITVLMVLCCARWKLLYRYTQNKSALCCSPPLSPQQRHSLSLSFSLFLPLISLHSACLFTSVSPHIQYICYSCSYFFSLILFPFSLSFSLLYVIFVCFLPLVISLPPACFKNPSQTQFATRSMLNPKGNKY